jgi:hypothetical protein
MRLIDDPREGARPVIAPVRRHPHRIAIALHDNPRQQAGVREEVNGPGIAPSG